MFELFPNRQKHLDDLQKFQFMFNVINLDNTLCIFFCPTERIGTQSQTTKYTV